LQQVHPKASRISSQFTFHCESTIADSLPWPLTPDRYHTLAPMSEKSASQTTNPITESKLASQTVESAQSPSTDIHGSVEPAHTCESNGKALPPRRRRPKSGREYVVAARERRQQQAYRNLRHPQAPEDAWICGFCEYELIFGSPPHALIRQYEVKDHQLRKQEAERKRLLEKAKLKGRKGKKVKAPKPTSQSVPGPHAQPDYDPYHCCDHCPCNGLHDDSIDDHEREVGCYAEENGKEDIDSNPVLHRIDQRDIPSQAIQASN
jgi:hypothetical protein